MKLINDDCLVAMSSIEDGSIGMVLTDPPYGTTDCTWDSIIPINEMWSQLKRVTKPHSAIVMTACQPFTTKLIASNLQMFRYCWIWHKNAPTGHLQARVRPMNDYEEVVVFSQKQAVYYPQGVIKKRVRAKRKSFSEVYKNDCPEFFTTGTNYPRRVISFNKVSRPIHPTQKPVELMEYLIKTYTNPGETVLDFTMGSGTTGVACVNLNREFIGIELDAGYFDIAQARITSAMKEAKNVA